MPSRARARARQEERDFQRYLEIRYQDEYEYEEEEEEEERALDEAVMVKPEYVITTILDACANGPREARINNFVTLFEYILTVPDFIKAHAAFCATAVAKARDFSTEPALRDVCERVVTAFGT